MAAHRLFDQHGVPALGKGRVRTAPRALLNTTITQRGAVPVGFPGMSNSQLKILAALSRAPFGLRSARRVADRAGVSPTVAARELKALQGRGFVQKEERVIASGRARVQEVWITDLQTWPAGLMRAVNQTVSPAARRADRTVGRRIPARFAHLFWNYDLGALKPDADASYIAGRMLNSPDLEAWSWALENLPGDGIDTALSRRGTPPAVRALVNNWRARGSHAR